MATVVIALGSNLGDCRAAIAEAITRLSVLVPGILFSDLIETEPDGEGLQDQSLYLNGVGVGETELEPRAILAELQLIEQALGRERPYPGAARTLDLDLIVLGEQIIDEPGLQIPHPRFRERFFVLGPLAEVAPDLVDPLTGLRVAQLLRMLLRDETR